MICPLCRQRTARRRCPAVGHSICAICCGTKRLTEIDCPASCAYLATSREHPAAVVKRQQERDAMVLLPTVQHLTERQYQLLFLCLSVIVRHVPEGFARLLDDDVAEAAAAVAATLETAARGVVYEHTPQTLPAQRLAAELRAIIEEARQQGATIYDREAAIALRAIEQGARRTRTVTDGSDTSYQTLVRRLLQANRGSEPTAAQPPGSSLILP